MSARRLVLAIVGAAAGSVAACSRPPPPLPTAPGAPQGVAASAGIRQVLVSWTAPASDGGSPVTGYLVASSPGGGSQPASGTSATVAGLDNRTAYAFTVQAVNAVGTGPASAPASATTFGAPDAPTAVQATPGAASAAVTWTAPASDGGSPITGYTVTASPGGPTANVSGTTTANVTGLTNGTAYTFTVVATNAVGDSPLATSSAVIPATTPDAPANLAAVRGLRQIALEWSAPASNGGSEVTSYLVTPHGGAATPVPTGTAATVTGLDDGTAYTFDVQALNGVGAGAAATLTASTFGVPSAPLDAAALGGDASATVSWAAPASDGGTEVTGYEITSTPPTTTQPAAADATSIVFPGLGNGTPYTFTVAATNAVGDSPGATTPTVTPATFPGPPTGVVATGEVGPAAIVTWTAPAVTGGSAILDYPILQSEDGGPYTPSTAAVDVASETASVSSVIKGAHYTFEVISTNAVGDSAPSDPSAPVRIPIEPDPPGGLSAAPLDGGVHLAWSAPGDDGGLPITSYRVTADPGGLTLDTADDPPETALDFTGLANDQSYTFTVQAGNAVGFGDASENATATPEAFVQLTQLATLEGGIGGLPFNSSLEPSGGRLFFSFCHASSGCELWTSDFTAAGTVMVKDICPGTCSSSIFKITDVGGVVLFRASENGDLGPTQLWRSDGTEAGTALVMDDVVVDTPVVVNGTLFFGARGGLWKSDGTAAGTVQVKLVRADSGSLTAANGTLFFTTSAGSPPDYQLWKSDGTEAGTVSVAHVQADLLTSSNGRLYFRAPRVAGPETWTSDGTAAGTGPLEPLFYDNLTSVKGTTLNVNGTLFYTALEPGVGYSLRKTDGTWAGTIVLKQFGNNGAPGSLVNMNGTLIFAASDGASGRELWKSDGTVAGTAQVMDINPGSADSSPQNLYVDDFATVYFSACEPVAGCELWRSQGTLASTLRVKDINPGAGDSSPKNFAYNSTTGLLYFTACEPTGGCELWKSNGAAAGTVMVADVAAGAADSNPTFLTMNGTTVFFSACDAFAVCMLWKSDGTAAGTTVLDSNPRAESPQNLIRFPPINVVIFSAFNASTGRELWKSTATTPALVKDIVSGSGSSNPEELTNMNNTLFFTARPFGTFNPGGIAYLYQSNGTVAFTVDGGSREGPDANLVNVNGTLYFTSGFYVSGPMFDGGLFKATGTAGQLNYQAQYVAFGFDANQLTNVNGKLYFRVHEATGDSIWTSNGTQAGTVPVVAPAKPLGLADVGGTLLFLAQPAGGHVELRKSDGTAAGTVLVKDLGPNGSPYFVVLDAGGKLFIQETDYSTWPYTNTLWASDGTTGGTASWTYPGSANSGATDFTGSNGSLLFRACDFTTHDCGLWKSDGTNAGTVLVQNLGQAAYGFSIGNANGRLLYTTRLAGRQELWASDGAPAAAVRLGAAWDLAGGAFQPSPTISSNGAVYFAAVGSAGGLELWKTDATAAGTARVAEIPGSAGLSLARFATGGGTLFFIVGGEYVSRAELWKTDGTQAGTVLVKNMNPGSCYPAPRELADVNGAVFFDVCISAYQSVELWKADGAGAAMVRRFESYQYGSPSPRDLTNVNGTLFFVADDGVLNPGDEVGLFKYAGTSAGVVLVKDIFRSNYDSDEPHNLVNMDGTLYFSIYDLYGSTSELWKSDGSTPVLVETLTINNNDYLTRYLASFAPESGTLLFTADETATGRELWKTDGTEVGTALVDDIFPGSVGSNPGDLTGAGGTMFFGACEPSSGCELWKSDGTGPGTQLVQDSVAGASPSNPRGLFGSPDGALVYSSTSGSDGHELWVSAGTAATTHRLAQIVPGAASSSPASFAVLGSNLVFFAHDGKQSYQLWAMPLAAIVP